MIFKIPLQNNAFFKKTLVLGMLSFYCFQTLQAYHPIAFATIEIQGHRNTMEDNHYNNPDGFFGIFDGHAGAMAAKFCAQCFYPTLTQSSHFESDPLQALHETFLKIHEAYKTPSDNSSDNETFTTARPPDDGTTAVVALIKENQLYVANAGDARAVLCSNNSATRVSFDHKLNDENEKTRIETTYAKSTQKIFSETAVTFSRKISTRSLIHFDPFTGEETLKTKTHEIFRIFNSIAISRAIGDYSFNPFIIPDPFTYTQQLTGQEQFLILASDGLWDVMEDQAAVNFVLFTLAKIKSKTPNLFTTREGIASITQKTTSTLVEKALLLGSRDNITVTIILFPATCNTQPLARDTASRRTAPARSDSEQEAFA